MYNVQNVVIEAIYLINAGMLLDSLLGIQDKKDNHNSKGEMVGHSHKEEGISGLEEVPLQTGEEQLKSKLWTRHHSYNNNQVLLSLHSKWNNFLSCCHSLQPAVLALSLVQKNMKKSI